MSSLIQEPDLVYTRAAGEARDRAIFAWRRAANFNPLVISSQAGTGSFLSDHPAAMMFYLTEVNTATTEFIDALQAQADETMAVAEATSAE